MRELNKEDIQKNRVDTIAQYCILDYLKKNMNINEFQVFLINRDTIKVIDKENEQLYFSYDKTKREVFYYEKQKEKDLEMGL